MMKCCPKCNGRGTVGYFHIDHFVDIECDRCNGSGEVSETDMTNEEWLKSMNTEQFAEALAWIEDRGELPTVRKENVKAFEKWLKEKHDDH